MAERNNNKPIWAAFFSEKELAEGEAFFRTGSAKKITNDGGESYSCIVRDDRNYRPKVWFYEDDLIDMECVCKDFIEKGSCSHLAALMFLADKEYDISELFEEDYHDEDAPWDHNMDGNERSSGMRDDPADIIPFPGASVVSAGRKTYGSGLKAAFRNLSELQKTESREHEGESESVYIDDEYVYFHADDFLNGLKYSQEDMAKARKLFNAGKYEKPRVTIKIDTSAEDHPMIGEMMIYVFDDDAKYYGNMVNITFTADSISYSSCYGWSCVHTRERSASGRYLCKHELIAILVLQEYIKTHNPGDKTDIETQRLLRELGSAVSDDMSDKSGKLIIEPYINRGLRTGLTVSFRIGYEKLYKINNLAEVRDAIQRGDIRTFGKNTEMALDISYLSEGSKKWFSFIDSVLEEQDMQIRYFDSHRKSYRENSYSTYSSAVPLFGKNLDDFFEYASGSGVEATFDIPRGKRKKRLTFGEGEYRLSLNIKPDMEKGIFHGVVVSGSHPYMYRGQSSFYYIDDDRMLRISEDISRKMRLFLNSARGSDIELLIGRKNLKAFYRDSLPKIREFAEVTIEDEDMILSHIPPVPQFITYFDCQDGFIVCRVEAYYGNRCVDPMDLLTEIDPAKHFEGFRDIEAEDELMDVLLEYVNGYDPLEHVLLQDKNDAETFELLTKGIDRISKLSDIRATDRFRRMLTPRKSSFNVGVSVESDLMNLSVMGEDLTNDEIYEILSAYKRKQKFYKLTNGSFMRLEEDEALEKLIILMDSLRLTPKEFVSGKMHLPLYRALYIEKMLEDSEELRLERDQKFRSLIREFKSVEDAEFEVPEELVKIMRAYQVTGYRWMRSLDHYGFGGILADEMGLGKTMQAIAVVSSVITDGEKALVACPASLVYNWQEEVMRYAPDLKPVVIAGTAGERKKLIAGKGEGRIWITSYDLLKRDIAEYEGINFRLFFIDEAQYIKNQNTAAAKSVRLVKAKCRFALTGTPIENRLGELWSIFEFLMPGFLYDYQTFRSEIETPIVKDGDEATGDRLKKMVTPFILRRKKQDVLKELPEKLEETRYAKMEKTQAKLYDAQAIHMKAIIGQKSDEEINRSRIEILAELMKIRQICCDPRLCFEDYKAESTKRELCLDLLQSLKDGGHKTLLFSQFTSMLELLENDLKKAGLSYYKITGATPKEQRLKFVNEFNKDDTPVFLISLKAGGTGLNLVGADSVIHYDPWWNVSAENQATDRAHRIGQKRVVTVYKLIIKDSIEEKIIKMQEAKAKLADDILSADGISSSSLSKEELMELLL